VRAKTSLVALLALLAGGLALAAQQAIPDAPAPQKATPPGMFSGVTPGQGTTPTSNNEDLKAPVPDAPKPGLKAVEPQTVEQGPPEALPPTGAGPTATRAFVRVHTNFVEVPVTVKDSKGALVPGLTWRNFQVLENGQPQRISLFTVDPFPISAAIVVDQSLPADVMKKVNDSLAAMQGAFTPQDEVAVLSYNNGVKVQTEFTGAASARVNMALQKMKTKGRDMGVPVNSGPLAGGISVNGKPNFDNNQTMHPHGGGSFITIPKEIHTLNDALLAAAQQVSSRGSGRRRIVLVISDGKEQGSKASFKQVRQYLLTNQVSVYAALVGDSATFGEGWLDRLHIPLTMRDNILPQYAAATGGQAIAGFSQTAIESAYAHIAEQVRLQYTIGYNSHIPTLDSRYRTIEVQVNKPGLTVIARPGYYPTPAAVHQ